MTEPSAVQGSFSGPAEPKAISSTPISPNTPPAPQAPPPISQAFREDNFEKRIGLVRAFLAQVGTQTAFCKAHGVHPATFSGWLNEYKRVGEAKMRSNHEKLLEGGVHNGPYSTDERRHAVETYLKSGQSFDNFARVWGIGESTLRYWVERYQEGGPQALEKRVTPAGRPRYKGVRELVERVKKENPTFGFRKIRDNLARIFGVKVSAGSVRNALKDKGYPKGGTRKKREKRQLPRRFERSSAGDLWQSDITSFVLTRHGVRVYLTVFLDDYSRYIVSWGLFLHQKGDIVIDTLMQGIERFGKPKEVLTDQGRQYFTWRGKGDFQKLLIREGIQHVVARSHHPQTVGKTERFWATVKEEFWDRVHPQDLADTRGRLGHFIAHYNHFRPHQGIDGMVPADRFFGAENQVRKALEAEMNRNELNLALGESLRKPVFLVGQIGDQQVSLHGERGKLIVQTQDGIIQELGMEGLGAALKEEKDGRGEGKEAEKGQAQEEVQVPGDGSHPGEGGVGSGERGGEGEGAPDRGRDPGVLDGKIDPGSGGPEASNAEVAGVAALPPSPVGAGGGVGETAPTPGQEGAPGGVAG